METIYERLSAPFEEEDLEWRCGATNADKTKCLALVYVNNRAIMNRLDEVMGSENWQTSFRRHGDKGVICTLSLKINSEWVHKEDGAEDSDIESVKGGISDAMKRAAVQWGIGRYLYNAEATWEPAKSIGKSTVLASRPTLKLKAKTQKWTLDEALKHVGSATDEAELTKLYKQLPPTLQKDEEVIAKCKEVKEGLLEIINNQ